MANQFRANLFGVVAATRAAAAHLPDNGRIVLVSSLSAVGSFGSRRVTTAPPRPPWRRTGGLGPRVRAAGHHREQRATGPIDTEMLDREAAGDALLTRLPLRRLGGRRRSPT